MGSILKLKSLVSLFGLTAVVGVAAAQTGEAPAAPPARPSDSQREVTGTPQQLLAEAKAFAPAMDRTASVVRRQLAEARENRDVVRVLCLNDKLNQIDLAIRTANDRIEALNAAVTENDAVRAKHEYTVAQVLKDRVTALGGEANACIGEQSGFVDESKVKVDIDPSVADTDPSEPTDPPMITEPPVLTSPTL
jgi:hypothetical protein